VILSLGMLHVFGRRMLYLFTVSRFFYPSLLRALDNASFFKLNTRTALYKSFFVYIIPLLKSSRASTSTLRVVPTMVHVCGQTQELSSP